MSLFCKHSSQWLLQKSGISARKTSYFIPWIIYKTHQYPYTSFKSSVFAKEVEKKKKQLVLGIETSCDDTGAAVVSCDGQVLGEALTSQQNTHLRFGGIIPPLARQLHEKNIEGVVNSALSRAGITVNDLSAIATTVMPGMGLSLSVGLSHGKALSLSSGKPFIPVHHMEAHATTVRLVEKVEYPFLVLLVSGGHCLLVLARSVDDWAVLGSTKDNAPGEVFDKVARRLKLRNLPQYATMSGGRAIELLAQDGDPHSFFFQASRIIHQQGCSFSFSGMIPQVEKIVRGLEEEQGVLGGQVVEGLQNVCASFQRSIAEHLLRSTHKAMIYIDTRQLLPQHSLTLVVSGGVACNQYIRTALQKLCDTTGYRLVCPPPHLCCDNGIMIAWNGMERWLAGKGVLYNKEEIEAVRYEPKAPMGEDLSEDIISLGIKMPRRIKI